MKLEELITKLEQIEQQAALTLSEYPHGLTVERQRLIVGIAKQVRSHLMDELQVMERRPAQNDPEPQSEADSRLQLDRPHPVAL
jgi:hypothetical protein